VGRGATRAQVKQTRATTRAHTQHLDAGRGRGRGGSTDIPTEAMAAGAVGTWGASRQRSGGIRGGATINGLAGPSHARSTSGGGGAAAGVMGGRRRKTPSSSSIGSVSELGMASANHTWDTDMKHLEQMTVLPRYQPKPTRLSEARSLSPHFKHGASCKLRN
jgi:hypothetical protein